MQRSETLTALLPALLKAQAALKAPKKTAINPHFNSHYAPLEEVLGAVLPALHAHDLVLLQPISSDGDRVTVTTLVMHKSGEWISADLAFHVPGGTAIAIGSAITYGRRYGLALVGVAAEADDDGMAATRHETTTAPAVPAGPPPPDDGALRVVRVEYRPTKNPNVQRATVILSDGRMLTTINRELAGRCERFAAEQISLLNVETKQTQWGTDLIAVDTIRAADPDDPQDHPADAADIPF